MVLVLLLLPLSVQAQTTPANEPALLDYVWGGLHKLPNMREGVFIDLRNHRTVQTLSLKLWDYAFLGKFGKYVSSNVNYIGSDGVGGSIDLDLSFLPVEDVPIIKYVEYLSVGYGGGFRTLTVPTGGNPGSDNKWIMGITVAAKFNF